MEHIQVVLPDDPSWWDDNLAASPFPTPSPKAQPPKQTRRRLIVAGVVAGGLVAAATVAVVLNDDDPERPATEVAAGHFVLDGVGLRAYSADIVTPLPTDARYTLFASGNPTNPWISLQTYRQRGDAPAALDSFRRGVDGHNLVTPRNERSVTTIVVDLGGGWAVDVKAFNIEDRELVRFADSVALLEGSNGDVQFDEAILAAHSLMATRTATWASELLYGTVTTEMRSVTADGATITLREAPADVDTRPATLAYFTTGRVEGAGGYTASTLIPSGDAIVTWSAAGRLLSLTGPVPPSELLAISRSVRLADENEWRQLVYGLHPDYRLGEFAELASNAADEGPPWSSGFQLADSGGRTEFLWWWTVPGTDTSASTPTRADLAAGAGNETIVVGSATYVFVWVPAQSDAVFASVRAADGSTVKLQLRLFFRDVPVRLAATRIDVPGPVAITTA